MSFDVLAIGAASNRPPAGRVGVSISTPAIPGIDADDGAMGVPSIADRLGLGVEGDPAIVTPDPTLSPASASCSAHGDACASGSWAEYASSIRAMWVWTGARDGSVGTAGPPRGALLMLKSVGSS